MGEDKTWARSRFVAEARPFVSVAFDKAGMETISLCLSSSAQSGLTGKGNENSSKGSQRYIRFCWGAILSFIPAVLSCDNKIPPMCRHANFDLWWTRKEPDCGSLTKFSAEYATTNCRIPCSYSECPNSLFLSTISILILYCSNLVHILNHSFNMGVGWILETISAASAKLTLLKPRL